MRAYLSGYLYFLLLVSCGQTNFRALSFAVQWNLCIMDTLGPTKGVQIMQVSTFSSVLINRFHCIGTKLEKGFSDPSTPAHAQFDKSCCSKPAVFLMACFMMSFVTRPTPTHSNDLI